MKQIGIIAVVVGLYLIVKGVDGNGPGIDDNSMQFLGLFIFLAGGVVLTYFVKNRR